MNGSIVVVGAAMLDLITYLPRLPVAGETLHGSSFRMGYGGKGANQAVMAAKLGSQVAMVAKLGTDVFGDGTFENFQRQHVGTRHVHRTSDAFSGVAPIAVDDEGRNSIVIVAGANDHLTEEEVEQARPVIAEAEVVVCQLEIPLAITLAALRIARQEGVRTIVNPAPASERLPDELFALADIFCPNEHETELLTGGVVGSVTEASARAQQLRDRGAGAVVLTLGERGCLVLDDQGVAPLPSDAVDVVDTTGAGDAFVGSLAHFLARGATLREAAGWACRVASLSVTGRGTQSSFPDADGLPAAFVEELGDHVGR